MTTVLVVLALSAAAGCVVLALRLVSAERRLSSPAAPLRDAILTVREVTGDRDQAREDLARRDLEIRAILTELRDLESTCARDPAAVRARLRLLLSGPS